MSPRFSLRVTALTVAAAAAVAVHAASPTFWQVSNQADFLKGDAVESISIDSDGRLVLGPQHTIVHEATAPFLWSAFADAEGRLIVGSGNDGQVLRVAPDGRAEVAFNATELQAHAVAAGPDGSLYVATSPDGKVYQVTRDGTSHVVFDPPDKYLWALVTAPDGTLFVGAGDKGVVYRVAPDGTSVPFLKTVASHVTALALDPAGHLLVGTESPGQVLRVTRDGKAFVLLDSSYREVRRLRLDARGYLYAVAVSGRPPTETRGADRPPSDQGPTGGTPSVSTSVTFTAIGDVQVSPAAGPSPSAEPRRPSQGAVYRIAPDGLWDVLWESRDDSPYDVAFDASGALLVATGNQGKIFRISGEPVRTTLLLRAGAQQVTSFVRGPGGDLFGVTSNPGKVFRMSAAPAARGVYESEVRDATNVATWGSLRWRALVPPGTSLQISTRSGNTSAPDDAWSDWSAPYTNPDGAPITSPKARYLQWRAILTGTKGSTPVLTSVTTAYLPRNMRPAVDNVTVHPPGIVFQRPFSTGEAELAGFESGTSDGRPVLPVAVSPPAAPAPALGRRTYQKGLQTFVWKATDGDDDRLQYDVWYRREGETSWHVLKRGLWDPILTWDTTSVPDGTYTIKVVASDAPSNAPPTALQGDLESVAFDIDNTPPAIEFTGKTVQGGRTRVAFTVRDRQSPIQRVEYSLDASRWQVAYPADGLLDSRVEAFEILIDEAINGGNIIVRATDALNNVTTAVVGQSR